MAVGGGLFLTRSIAAAVVFAFGFYALTYLAIVLHEVGHFVAARLLRIDVPVMSLGGGARAKVLRLGRAFLILSPTPTEGLIIPAYASAEHFRKRSLVITAAGPVTNVLMALLGFAVLVAYEGRYLPDLIGNGLILWSLINLSLAVANLIPFSLKTAFGEVSSDGAQIWRIRRTSDEEIQQVLRRRTLLLASLEYAYGDMERCLAVLEQGTTANDDSIYYKTMITSALAETGRYDRGIELGREYLEQDGLGLMERAMLQNNLAFALLERGGEADLEEASRLSSMAEEVLPMIMAVKGTRGSVLIARERYRDGVERLSDVRFRLETRSHRATVDAIRAKGLARLGELDRAVESFRAAQSLEPANRHVSEAAAVIDSAPSNPLTSRQKVA